MPAVLVRPGVTPRMISPRLYDFYLRLHAELSQGPRTWMQLQAALQARHDVIYKHLYILRQDKVIRAVKADFHDTKQPDTHDLWELLPLDKPVPRPKRKRPAPVKRDAWVAALFGKP